MPTLLKSLGTETKDHVEENFRALRDTYTEKGDAHHTAADADSGKKFKFNPTTQDRDFIINTSAVTKGWKVQVKNLNATYDMNFLGTATLRTPGNSSPTTIKLIGSTAQYATAYLEAIADDEIVISGAITVT